MSVNSKYNKPAYVSSLEPEDYSNNSYILKWWTIEHDRILENQIAKWQWVWYWKAWEEIVKMVPIDIIDRWKNEDPLCHQYAWYNILMHFVKARGEALKLTQAIRIPKWRTCPLCGYNFVEDSIPITLIERIGIDRLDFCTKCLNTALFGTGNNKATKESIIEYFQRLTSLIERVPSQDFGGRKEDIDLIAMKDMKRLELLRLLLYWKPSLRRIKTLFGSWLNALIQAGVLEDGTRRTSRGTQCIAKDGHICFSIAEKTIDDYLFTHGISHEREISYPKHNFRVDFKVGNIFIEYFGLVGNPDYDIKILKKLKICNEHGIEIIAIYPKDLAGASYLEKLSIILYSVYQDIEGG